MTINVACVIPWRSSGDPDRRANLDAVVAHLTGWAQGRPVVLSSDGREAGQPFNRSAAYNAGMALALAEVYVFNEADMLVPYEQLDAAVRVAAASPGLVIPFDAYHYLSREDSTQVLAGAHPMSFDPLWTMKSIGPVNVVSAESMRMVGQWDETLSGHGYDDNCMERAFRIACNSPTHHIAGPAWHLYHDMAYAPWERGTPASNPANFSPEEVRATEWNRNRLRQYQKCAHPHAVRLLTMETRDWK